MTKYQMAASLKALRQDYQGQRRWRYKFLQSALELTIEIRRSKSRPRFLHAYEQKKGKDPFRGDLFTVIAFAMKVKGGSRLKFVSKYAIATDYLFNLQNIPASDIAGAFKKVGGIEGAYRRASGGTKRTKMIERARQHQTPPPPSPTGLMVHFTKAAGAKLKKLKTGSRLKLTGTILSKGAAEQTDVMVDRIARVKV